MEKKANRTWEQKHNLQVTSLNTTACAVRLESSVTCGQISANYVCVKEIPSLHCKSFHSFCTLFYSSTPKHPLILDHISKTHVLPSDTFQQTAPMFPLELLKGNLLLCHLLLETIRNTIWITPCQYRIRKKNKKWKKRWYNFWFERDKATGGLRNSKCKWHRTSIFCAKGSKIMIK